MADRETLKNKPEIEKLADELFHPPHQKRGGLSFFDYSLMITDQKYARLIDEALMGGKTLGLFAQKIRSLTMSLLRIFMK